MVFEVVVKNQTKKNNNMKKYQNRIIALVLLTSFAATSCSVQYRERRRARRHPVVTERVIIHN